MAAPRNDEERDRIYEAAIALFCSAGFNKVSYREIAEACSTSKSMVQHYFPKKDLFAIRFFEQHVEELAEKATGLSPDARDSLMVFTLMGLAHFDFLLNDAEYRAFIDDVVESRALTDAVVSLEREWAKEHLPKGAAIAAEDALTISLGGAYELVYQRLKSGNPTSAMYVERAAMVPFALVMGIGRSEVETALQQGAKLLGIAG